MTGFPLCLECDQRVEGVGAVPRSTVNPHVCEFCASLDAAFDEPLRLQPVPSDVLDDRCVVVEDGTLSGGRVVARFSGAVFVGDERTGRERVDPARDVRAENYVSGATVRQRSLSLIHI